MQWCSELGILGNDWVTMTLALAVNKLIGRFTIWLTYWQVMKIKRKYVTSFFYVCVCVCVCLPTVHSLSPSFSLPSPAFLGWIALLDYTLLKIFCLKASPKQWSELIINNHWNLELKSILLPSEIFLSGSFYSDRSNWIMRQLSKGRQDTTWM